MAGLVDYSLHYNYDLSLQYQCSNMNALFHCGYRQILDLGTKGLIMDSIYLSADSLDWIFDIQKHRKYRFIHHKTQSLVYISKIM